MLLILAKTQITKTIHHTFEETQQKKENFRKTLDYLKIKCKIRKDYVDEIILFVKEMLTKK